MLRISQLKLPVTHTEEDLKKKIVHTLMCRTEAVLTDPGGGYPRTADRKAVSGCQKEAGAVLCLYCGCKSGQ